MTGLSYFNEVIVAKRLQLYVAAVYVTPGSAIKRPENVQKGALPSAVRPDEGEDLTRLHVERNPFDGHTWTERLRERLGDQAYGQAHYAEALTQYTAVLGSNPDARVYTHDTTTCMQDSDCPAVETLGTRSGDAVEAAVG